MNLLKHIFSVHNEKAHKIVVFCGFKIKFRSVKAENILLKSENSRLKEQIDSLNKKNKKLSDKNASEIKKSEEYLKIIAKNADLYEQNILIPKKINDDIKNTEIAQKELSEILGCKEFPLFTSIEIETVNRCCGECAFCPVNKYDDTREYKLMSEDLFKNIIRQLKDINYDGRMQLFSNNEPLMDKRIFEFAKYAKEQLPNNHFSFFTNGMLLDMEKFHKLIPYCDTFCIDIYYSEDEKIPDNIFPIVDYCVEHKELQSKVIVNMIDKNAIRNNRGGNSKNRKEVYKLKCPCLLPFKQMIVRPDGKVSLCCNDALGEYTLGDLTQNSITEIWNGQSFWEVRNKLKLGREEIKMCEYCDNFGGFGTNAAKDYVYTKEHFQKSWNKIKSYLN